MVCDEEGTTIDADRMIEVLQSFETYQEVQRTSSEGVATTARSAAQRTTGAEQARDALRFLCSDEGATFRSFLVNEMVKGIDGLSREGARQLLYSLRLEWVTIPVLVPFVVRPLPLMPTVTNEDRRTVHNITKLVDFFVGTYDGPNGNSNTSSPIDVAGSKESLTGAYTVSSGYGSQQQVQPLANGPRISMPDEAVVREVLPVLPEVMGDLVPEILFKLGSRYVRRHSNVNHAHILVPKETILN